MGDQVGMAVAGEWTTPPGEMTDKRLQSGTGPGLSQELWSQEITENGGEKNKLINSSPLLTASNSKPKTGQNFTPHMGATTQTSYGEGRKAVSVWTHTMTSLQGAEGGSLIKMLQLAGSYGMHL